MVSVLFFLFLFFMNVEPQPPIQVLSYNIRYKNNNDGLDIWENRKARVTEFITASAPSFLGMQEVVHEQLQDLKQALPQYTALGVGREDGKEKGEYSPLFFQTQRFKLKAQGTFWLSESPDQVSKGWDAALERICTWGYFKDKKTQKKIWVFNTHFDHKGAEARAMAVELLLEKIKAFNTKGEAVLLMGDLNLAADTAPIKKLQKHLGDVLENLSPQDPTYGTFNGFGSNPQPTRRIDYIFQQGMQVLSASHPQVKTAEGRWASDHHPVWAVMNFNN